MTREILVNFGLLLILPLLAGLLPDFIRVDQVLVALVVVIEDEGQGAGVGDRFGAVDRQAGSELAGGVDDQGAGPPAPQCVGARSTGPPLV